MWAAFNPHQSFLPGKRDSNSLIDQVAGGTTIIKREQKIVEASFSRQISSLCEIGL
jgi:hypothetical protein